MEEKLEFENQQETEKFIIRYLEKKAEKTKNISPYNFFRLNEISYELKKIFDLDQG